MGGMIYGLPAFRRGQGTAFFISRLFKMGVGIFDHDNGPVNHGPDRDGDAAQRHDVGIDALPTHNNKSGKDADRQGQDRHQG